VKIHWKSGLVDERQAERVKPFPLTTDPDVVDRIEQLYLTLQRNFGLKFLSESDLFLTMRFVSR